MKDHLIHTLGRCSVLLVFALALSTTGARAQGAIQAAGDRQRGIKRAVDLVIQPMMAKYGIRGVAVGVISGGKPYVFVSAWGWPLAVSVFLPAALDLG